MKIMLIVDFMHLYYKYKFTIESNRIKRLTADVSTLMPDGTVQLLPTDISNIFYPIKEIEGFRKKFEAGGNEVHLAVCFDRPPTDRRDNDTTGTYKSKRGGKINDIDLANIAFIKNLLAQVGHNSYMHDGAEADDLIQSLVDKQSKNFDFTVIYTSDADMLACVAPNVGVQMYKIRKGYTPVSAKNFESYCLSTFNVRIPFNAIVLYKILCGDKSDEIKGVKGFGPVAYSNFVKDIDGKVDWSQMSKPDSIQALLNEIQTTGSSLEHLLDKSQVKQALEALSLVEPISYEIAAPESISTPEKRLEFYGQLGMNSLV